MLEHFNNVAQPIASDVDIVDYDVPAADGAQLRARWYYSASGGGGAAALFRHGGGMILGSVAGVSQRARADRHRVLKSL
jgi:acetyl esterase/lipase